MNKGRAVQFLKELIAESEKEVLELLKQSFVIVLARYLSSFSGFKKDYPVCSFSEILQTAKNVATPDERKVLEIVSRFRAEEIFIKNLEEEPQQDDLLLSFKVAGDGRRMLIFVEEVDES